MAEKIARVQSSYALTTNASQHDTAGPKGASMAPPARNIGTRDPSGKALPASLQVGLETLAGLPMGDVQVHYDSPKPAQLQALAYAEGSNIHLSPGQEQQLPHEAWHVVQQKQGRVQPARQMKNAATANNALEQEADIMGERAAGMPVSQQPIATLPIRNTPPSFTPCLQLKEADEQQMARPKTTIRDDADKDTIIINGIPAFHVIDAKTGGKPKRRLSGGGGSYARLKGKEFIRAGNSVSWLFAIPLTYTEEVITSPLPNGQAALQKFFPSVNIVTAVKVVSDRLPPVSPIKLAMAQQMLGMVPPEPNASVLPGAEPIIPSIAASDPQQCDAAGPSCEAKPSPESPLDIGPRADVALAEQLNLSNVTSPFDLKASVKEQLRYGGKAPNADEVQWAVPGYVPTPLRKQWAPEAFRGIKVNRDQEGYLEINQPGLVPWSANPHRQVERFYAGDIAHLQRGEAARQELEANGGKPVINGQPLNAQQWALYKQQRIREIRAQVNSQLTNLDEAVKGWSEVQQEWVIAASASHFFGGRSLLDGYQIAQSADQELEIGLEMIRKARTATELAEGEHYALGAASRGSANFTRYKEDVYQGGERTITGIKGVAVGAVAAVAAPALFAAAGGIAVGEAGFATATLGGQAWATAVSTIGSGTLTGSLGGALESVDHGLNQNNFAKGFKDNFSTGFAAGLSAGSSALLKVGPEVTLANLPGHLAINAGTGAAGTVVDATLHGKSPGDEKAGYGYWNLVSGATVGAFTGVAGAAIGGRLKLPKLANAGFQAGYDAAVAGVIATARGGSKEDIYLAMVTSGAIGGVGAMVPRSHAKPATPPLATNPPKSAKAPPTKPTGVVIHGIEGSEPPSGNQPKRAPAARYRRPPNKEQREEAIAHYEKMAQRWRAMGMQVPELWSNMDNSTMFMRPKPGVDADVLRINIGYNAAPASNPNEVPIADRANASLSPRAAMAHEGGHAEAHAAGRTQASGALEEFQASMRAALTDPDLPLIDRKALIDDAFARLGDYEQAHQQAPSPGREMLKPRFRKPTKVMPPGLFLDPLGPQQPADAAKPQSGRLRFGINGEGSNERSVDTPKRTTGQGHSDEPAQAAAEKRRQVAQQIASEALAKNPNQWTLMTAMRVMTPSQFAILLEGLRTIGMHPAHITKGNTQAEQALILAGEANQWATHTQTGAETFQKLVELTLKLGSYDGQRTDDLKLPAGQSRSDEPALAVTAAAEKLRQAAQQQAREALISNPNLWTLAETMKEMTPDQFALLLEGLRTIGMHPAHITKGNNQIEQAMILAGEAGQWATNSQTGVQTFQKLVELTLKLATPLAGTEHGNNPQAPAVSLQEKPVLSGIGAEQLRQKALKKAKQDLTINPNLWTLAEVMKEMTPGQFSTLFAELQSIGMHPAYITQSNTQIGQALILAAEAGRWATETQTGAQTFDKLVTLTLKVAQ